MDAYSGFAEVYDRFMENVPYEQWSESLIGLLRREGIADGLVLDLGCGTGQITRRLSAAGYDMIGVDNSEEMLAAARAASGPEILYLNQDMREFELYGTVRAVVSAADTMNYLTEPADFVQTLRLVNNYLDPDGIFVFDLKTEHCFRDIMGEQTFAENAEDASLIWENAYYEEERLNEYALTLFLRRPGGLFERCEETHLQRAYTEAEIREMTAQAGMEFVCSFDAENGGSWDGQTERACVILRERGKRAARRIEKT